MQESSSHLSQSPDKSPRFVQELRDGTVSDSDFQDFSLEGCKQTEQENRDKNDEDVSDGDFEFSIVSRDEQSVPVTADEIFHNGQIRPVRPLFNTDLVSNALCTINEETAAINTKTTSNRLPLQQLFSEERELASSSFEADGLDGAEPGTYCVWTPKKVGESSPVRCKKSGSVVSSYRWKFRDLLYRRHNESKTVEAKEEEKGGAEEKYVKRSRTVKEGEKRRYYLPYRQDLFGILTNVNVGSRSLDRR